MNIREYIKNRSQELLISDLTGNEDNSALNGYVRHMYFADFETSQKGTWLQEINHGSSANCIAVSKLNTTFDKTYHFGDIETQSFASIWNNETIEWLLKYAKSEAKENKYIVITFHNFAGFDGLFLKKYLLKSPDWSNIGEYSQFIYNDKNQYYVITITNGYLIVKLLWIEENAPITERRIQNWETKLASLQPDTKEYRMLVRQIKREIDKNYKITYCYFCDTMRLFPMAVAAMGNKGNTMEDTSILREPNLTSEMLMNDKNLRPYCENDTILVANFFKTCLNKFNEYLTNKRIPLTAGSTTMTKWFRDLNNFEYEWKGKRNEIKHGYTKEMWVKENFKITTEYQTLSNLLFHNTYNGGLTSYRFKSLKEVIPNVVCIDVNSQYPHKMVVGCFGIGKVYIGNKYEYNTFYQHHIDKINSMEETPFVCLKVIGIQQTDKSFAFLKSSNLLYRDTTAFTPEDFVELFGVPHTDYISDKDLAEWRRVYDKRQFEFNSYSEKLDVMYYFCSIYEWEKMKALCKYEKIEIFFFCYWTEYQPVWRDTLLEIMNEKTKAKKEGFVFFEKFYKILGNSSYGKISQNVVTETIFYAKNGLREGVVAKPIENEEYLYKLPTKNNSWYMFSYMGSLVTSLSRGWLLDMVKQLIDRGYIVHYCDTDSIFFSLEGHDINDIYKIPGITTDKVLGNWDIEKDKSGQMVFNMYIANKKKYIFYDNNGKIFKMALAGINKKKALDDNNIDWAWLEENNKYIKEHTTADYFIECCKYNKPLVTLVKEEDDNGVNIVEATKNIYDPDTYLLIEDYLKTHR